MIVFELALQREETDFLQNNIAERISQNFLFYPIATVSTAVFQAIERYTRLRKMILKLAIFLFF